MRCCRDYMGRISYIMPYIGCTGIPCGFRRDSTGFVWDGTGLM